VIHLSSYLLGGNRCTVAKPVCVTYVCLVSGTILLMQILLKSDHMAKQCCHPQFMNHSVNVSKYYAEFLSSVIALGKF